MNRRDFLKLLALLPALAATRGIGRALTGSKSDAPGVIVLVLDALSAMHLSLHGYARKTSSHIERFAARSNVYHAHYSAANFTSSGTASLLAGSYPWTHRAFHYEGLIAADKVDANVFRYWGEGAFRLGFTQNAWADLLLYQCAPWLESHLDLRAFSIDKRPLYTSLLKKDPIAAHKALDSFALELEPGLGAASLLTLARKLSLYRGKRDVERTLTEEYPLGIPQTLNDLDTYFLLENLFDGLMDLTASLEANSFAYLHLFPPHYPYAPRADYLEAMQDGWRPPVKRNAPFRSTVSAREEEEIQKSRDKYDAYIATVDEDFGRLFDFWEREGILERNYVVLTSDHGEIYERGVLGHTNEYLYEPLIRVPLIVSSPGQTTRVDVRTPTSSVDVIPTLLALTGRSVPPTSEGVLLPGLGGEEDAARAVFAIDTKSSHVRGPIRTSTIAVRKGPYKLIAYLGYEGVSEAYEMYDVETDPEEMTELSKSKPETFADLRREIEEKLQQVNAPFQSGA